MSVEAPGPSEAALESWRQNAYRLNNSEVECQWGCGLVSTPGPTARHEQDFCPLRPDHLKTTGNGGPSDDGPLPWVNASETPDTAGTGGGARVHTRFDVVEVA